MLVIDPPHLSLVEAHSHSNQCDHVGRDGATPFRASGKGQEFQGSQRLGKGPARFLGYVAPMMYHQWQKRGRFEHPNGHIIHIHIHTYMHIYILHLLAK